MKVYFWEEKILFQMWTKKIGNFDSVQTDINFCKNVIRVLSKRPLYSRSIYFFSNLLLRRSRIKYFKLRYQAMVRLKYRMRKERRSEDDDPLQAQSQCVSIFEIQCQKCGNVFSSKAKFVDNLPQVTDGCCYEEGK